MNNNGLQGFASKHVRKERIRWIDWLLILGGVLAPMTGLRVWKIGPAEVLCLIWSIWYVRLGRIELDDFKKFFSMFLLSMIIGTAICSLVAPNELGKLGLVTWLYLSFIACSLFVRLQYNQLVYNERLLSILCHLAVLWYLFLFIYSRRVSLTFYGAPLWYYSRYTGGGTNPHQVAVLLCGVSFWLLGEVFRGRHRIWNFCFFVVAVYLESKTKSSTGDASVFIGVFISTVIFVTLNIRDRRARSLVLILMILFALLIAVLFRNVIYNVLYEWVADDKNGLGRFQIWSSFGQTFKKSPIFGLGPGSHAVTAYGTKREFHNSYLEVYAISGIIGFVAFISFSVKLIKEAIKADPYLLSIIVSMYVYSMAGFAIRRLAFWILIAFVRVISLQMIDRDNHNQERITNCSRKQKA